MFRRFFRQMHLRKDTTIRSQASPEVYLRCEASDVTEPIGSGGGTANCQYTPAKSYARYRIYPVEMKPALAPTDKYLVHIESTCWNNVHIRMDGSGCQHPHLVNGGIVNCQYGAYSFEKFYLQRAEGTTVSFQSFQFPHCLLRLEGSSVTEPTPNGGGTVNCQYQEDPDQPAGALQRFYLGSV